MRGNKNGRKAGDLPYQSEMDWDDSTRMTVEIELEEDKAGVLNTRPNYSRRTYVSRLQLGLLTPSNLLCHRRPHS